jgi:hypothetical protein
MAMRRKDGTPENCAHCACWCEIEARPGRALPGRVGVCALRSNHHRVPRYTDSHDECLHYLDSDLFEKVADAL